VSLSGAGETALRAFDRRVNRVTHGGTP
jgi:hypothetical protein